MSNKPYSKRTSPGEKLHTYFAPVLKSSPEYHIFRLESLFQALQDLWMAGTRKRHDSAAVLAAYRRVQAITGVNTPTDVPADSWFIMPFLVLGSMICNDAIHALEASSGSTISAERSTSSVENYLLQMRNLLIALHDFLEANTYQKNYPQENQAARMELASLLGPRAPVTQNELIHASFVTGSEIATTALATLQHARQTV